MEDYINRSVVFESISPEVDVTTTGTEVVVQISAPAAAMTAFGTLNFALGDRVSTRIVHAMEPS